jgi:hypothetical protein
MVWIRLSNWIGWQSGIVQVRLLIPPLTEVKHTDLAIEMRVYGNADVEVKNKMLETRAPVKQTRCAISAMPCGNVDERLSVNFTHFHRLNKEILVVL